MTAAVRMLDTAAAAPVHEEIAPRDREMLNRLRLSALTCRARARLDLFRACAMLSGDREAAAESYAEALLRTLDQGLGRPARFYRPGAGELSFDERWLLALMRALREGDAESATFLLASRLPKHVRRSLAFLARGAGEGLDKV